MKMNNARSTIRSSIIAGLCQNAHITGASIKHAEIQTKNIIEAVFHPSVLWSVKDYIKEIENKR
jgi:CO dehydrogenase/acetyl-CoA synthase alpha subunit